jgi:hypothetical protein
MYPQFKFLWPYPNRPIAQLKGDMRQTVDENIEVEREGDLEGLHLNHLASAKFRNTHDYVNILLVSPYRACLRWPEIVCCYGIHHITGKQS